MGCESDFLAGEEKEVAADHEHEAQDEAERHPNR